MTEKTEYITASIGLLEKRDELNSDELAVLCNLKKFMNNDHQQTFEVGEYYVCSKHQIYRVDNIVDNECFVTVYHTKLQNILESSWLLAICEKDKPATTEQIATFKRAEHFASKGRKLDEWHEGDKASIAGENELTTVEGYENGMLVVDACGGCYFDPDYLGLTLIQTAEELREVNNNE